MRKQIVILLVVMSLVIFTGCTNQNEQNEGHVSSTPTVSTANTASQSNTKQEVSSDKGDEQLIENEAFKALQVALDWMKAIDSLTYNSYSKTLIHHYNWDNPSTTIEDYYITDSYGEMQRQPAIAHTRNQTIIGSSEMKGEEEINSIESNTTFSDYYVSKEYGLFYNYEEAGERVWVREDLSDEFRTMAHLEELIELFMQYPDQLVMKKNESEEEFEGKSDEEFHTISLNLTNDQYWDLIPYINSNFFTGTYDIPQYDDQTFTLISRDLSSFQISLLLDGDYTLVAFDVSYKGMQLDGKEGEDYSRLLNLYFYNFNTTEVPAVPE